MQKVIVELIEKMTVGLPENVKLQINLENNRNERVNQTKLLCKAEMILKLTDWVILFIDYYDTKPEDITFKLLTIKIPTGKGKIVNKIITVDSKRSIIQITNKDTICLARALIVGLAAHHKQKLGDIFRSNLTEDELKQINKTRQSKSRINEGIISDNETDYIKKGREIQTVLANTLHRLCKVPIKETGNDFEDAKHFEEKLNIQIQIYDLESRQIYKGKENHTKVYILMTEAHHDVISKLTGFTCANEDQHKAEYKKCKACKSETKCDFEIDTVSCDRWNKNFYGKSCLNNHIANKKCTEYSYMCKICHRFYKSISQ